MFLQYNALGQTGLQVSQAGFGCYRVDVSVSEHREAMRKALLGGVNVLDTSSNYSDGGSEELVGKVLAEMTSAGEIDREQVVVVSKAGYLQGHNYRLSQQRKREGMPFLDLVLYGEGLEHCIHPEFLEDQLTASLERLQMQALDVYLLHNPEYYLGFAKQNGMQLDEAREEYYRRIELAFRHLEGEVERGRIRWYGISSNTFPAPAEEYLFTSLERVWEIAESISDTHHFRVIQLPMNLLERGGVIQANQSNGQSVLKFARDKGLGVLINRPLNAFVANSLVRLADLPMPDVDAAASVTELIEKVVAAEALFRQDILPLVEADDEVRASLADKLTAGALLQEHGRKFASLDHWQEVVQQFFVPTVQSGVQKLLETPNLPPEVGAWLEGYVNAVNETFLAVTEMYKQRAAEVSQELKRRVAQADAQWGEAGTLSGMALRALRSTDGVSSVLVGMRREAYVEDVLAELQVQIDVKDRFASWEGLGQKF
ncbi:aldo/keto reductase [Tumebacillus sp. ITR2]|uniref:Aldo/keto reductase n=1 Tax=Tumebacillus amylolyticus TaxID=2801339 RepID=A0ABS1JEV4_9BACL|nr:aldo/keto reductase [Tumebacillus amylolyticus]MBL0388816.1 aldo/keto reductase [Tumebacillus amylolyticus]